MEKERLRSTIGDHIQYCRQETSHGGKSTNVMWEFIKMKYSHNNLLKRVTISRNSLLYKVYQMYHQGLSHQSNNYKPCTKKCNYCPFLGHTGNECQKQQYHQWHRGEAHLTTLEEQYSTPMQLLYTQTGFNDHTMDNNWYFDIGTTHHMTFDWSALSNYNQLQIKMDVREGEYKTSCTELSGFLKEEAWSEASIWQ